MGSNKQFEGVYPRQASILISFQWEGRRHRERIALAPTASNVRAANRLREDIVDAIRLGKFTRAEFAIHFPDSKWLKEQGGEKAGVNHAREVGEVWLKLLAQTKASTTISEYRNSLERCFSRQFGDRNIATIEYEELALHIASLKIKSAKTFNNVMTPIRGVFAYALTTGRIQVDITKKIPSMRPSKAKPDPLDIREIEIVLAQLAKRGNGQWLNYFEFALFSGLRPSEMIALRWGKIDQRRRKALIDEARVRATDKDDKTHRGREIDLQTRAFNALTRQKAHTFLLPGGGYVFVNPANNERFFDTDGPLVEWHAVLKSAGIRDRDARQTRHSFATTCLHANMNPSYVADQMGHVDKRMFFEVYAKWMEGDANQAEMSKLDKMFASNGL